ncbi:MULTISPECIES: hypothetical protein [unclassified Bradyrhizobium]|uniref:hypothetical protein n=1 Tax=unclassified Bradyrhizobium TaxID=2631580 RepID=UPI001FF9E491|nr:MULTISPECIES: hypothetical protein [unclassified Bradyrhizobium]MCK1540342.1 hypothetical protein [Bradyrhizobium sp. 176]MCK1556184.1 hypothetical protein [Bradyrhizobium sp. 171]
MLDQTTAMTDTPAPCAGSACASSHKPRRARRSPAEMAEAAEAAKRTISADEVPCDVVPIPYEAPTVVKLFQHTPVITRRIGDRVEVVTGPVKPVVPHTTEQTAEGWERFFSGSEAARGKAIADAKAAADEYKTFFEKRKADDAARHQARCKKAIAKGKEPPPRRRSKTPPPPNWVEFIRDPDLLRHMKSVRQSGFRKARLDHYKHTRGRFFADRAYDTFIEKLKNEDGTPAPAMRSWLKLISLQLFNGALRKDCVEFGYDKTTEFAASRSERMFALDASHVVLDKGRRCAFVVDLDRWWVDLATLRTVLRMLLPPEFMPNVITYRGREEDGVGVDGAHLAWLLPPGSRVLRGKGKAKQFKLWEMIQKSIVSLLIPVGADPGHTNVCKTKSPFAPGWSIEVCDDYFQTMDDWRNFLPTITPDEQEMRRRAKVYKAADQADVPVKESLAIWNDAKSERRLAIKSAQARQDPAYLAAVRKCTRDNIPFADWLYDPVHGVVTQRLRHLHKDAGAKAVRAVLAAQREFVIELGLTPSEIGEFCERGRDAILNEDIPPLPASASKEERKARADLLKHLARQRTQAHKELMHRGLIAEEIEARLAGRVPVVKAEVVKALVAAGNIGRSTAYDHYDDVLEVVQRTARYQVSPSCPQDDQGSYPVEETLTANLETEFSVNPQVTTASAPVVTGPIRRIPVNNARPAWVVDKDSLTLWEEACLQRDSWAVAVAAWRSAKARRRPAEAADLADDPGFRALVLQRSAWAQHRLH